jgi:hypothetical protein
MPQDDWRCTDTAVVPRVVGLHIRDAERIAHAAGLKMAQPDPDGPPLAALTWPGDYWITDQTPAAGAQRWGWDPIVVHWTTSPGHAGVREPRRPHPPLNSLIGELDIPGTGPQTGTQ